MPRDLKPGECIISDAGDIVVRHWGGMDAAEVMRLPERYYKLIDECDDLPPEERAERIFSFLAVRNAYENGDELPESAVILSEPSLG